MTRKQAREVIIELEEAEGVLAECNHAERAAMSPGAPDRLRVSCAGREMFVRPADLRPLAIWAVEDAKRRLQEAGYLVPGRPE